MVEGFLIAVIVILLIGTELLGVVARRFGFITISEAARNSRPDRQAVAALFIVGLIWWLIHSSS